MNETKATPTFDLTGVQELVYQTGVRIICGESSLTLYPDGRIELIGKSIIQCADSIQCQAEKMDFN